MEQRKKNAGYTTGANDLSFKNVDVPKVPQAIMIFCGEEAPQWENPPTINQIQLFVINT